MNGTTFAMLVLLLSMLIPLGVAGLVIAFMVRTRRPHEGVREWVRRATKERESVTHRPTMQVARDKHGRPLQLEEVLAHAPQDNRGELPVAEIEQYVYSGSVRRQPTGFLAEDGAISKTVKELGGNAVPPPPGLKKKAKVLPRPFTAGQTDQSGRPLLPASASPLPTASPKPVAHPVPTAPVKDSVLKDAPGMEKIDREVQAQRKRIDQEIDRLQQELLHDSAQASPKPGRKNIDFDRTQVVPIMKAGESLAEVEAKARQQAVQMEAISAVADEISVNKVDEDATQTVKVQEDSILENQVTEETSPTATAKQEYSPVVESLTIEINPPVEQEEKTVAVATTNTDSQPADSMPTIPKTKKPSPSDQGFWSNKKTPRKKKAGKKKKR